MTVIPTTHPPSHTQHVCPEGIRKARQPDQEVWQRRARDPSSHTESQEVLPGRGREQAKEGMITKTRSISISCDIISPPFCMAAFRLQSSMPSLWLRYQASQSKKIHDFQTDILPHLGPQVHQTCTPTSLSSPRFNPHTPRWPFPRQARYPSKAPSPRSPAGHRPLQSQRRSSEAGQCTLRHCNIGEGGPRGDR